MKESLEIIKNKIKHPRGTQVDINKKYAVIVIENGKKKSQYIFENEEQATQCYALLCNPNIEQDYIQEEEVFLTIYYEKQIFC